MKVYVSCHSSYHATINVKPTNGHAKRCKRLVCLVYEVMISLLSKKKKKKKKKKNEIIIIRRSSDEATDIYMKMCFR